MSHVVILLGIRYGSFYNSWFITVPSLFLLLQLSCLVWGEFSCIYAGNNHLDRIALQLGLFHHNFLRCELYAVGYCIEHI